MHRTVLPGVHAKLVDASRRLGQHVDGAAGGVHVIEEVDGQGGEGKHQHPEHGQQVSRHDELWGSEKRPRVKKKKNLHRSDDSLSDRISFPRKLHR